MPTLAGFILFIQNVMGISSVVLPTDSPVISYAFNVALMTVNPQLACVPLPCQPGTNWTIYEIAVYNLAGDRLVNFAPDQVGQTYFTDLRGSPNNSPPGLGLTNFVAGVVTNSSDESTSVGLTTPDSFKGMTVADLQNLKTPWGQTYIGIAQSVGSLVGLT
jgi:hypothetical protein